MYIFIKIHDERICEGNKPFIISETDLNIAMNKLCEKYYNVKFSSIINVIHYPRFLEVLETIRRL